METFVYTPHLLNKTQPPLPNFTFPPGLITTSLLPLPTTSNSSAESINNHFTFAVIYMVLTITGSISNLIIIVGITSCKLLWKPTYFYILNVAVSDFLICAVCCPFNVIALYTGRGPKGCAVAGVLMNVFMLASLISLSTVALNRYMLVKLSSDKYRSHFVCSRICLSTVIIWALSLICLLPLGFHGSPGYDRSFSICISSPNGSSSAFDTIQALVLGFPALCLIYYCYVQIWRVFRSSVQSTELPSNKRAVSSLKLTRNLFVVTTLYTLCWMPSFLLMIFDTSYRAPKIIHQCASVFAVMHSTINPITYLVLNRNLASAYYGMFLCFRKNSNLRCCGCLVFCVRGQALPPPSSTGGKMNSNNPLRRISNHMQRLRTSSTMSIFRKVSEPILSSEQIVPPEPTRRTSEPPPHRRLSIVIETQRPPRSNSSTRTRRTHVSLDSPPVITVTEIDGLRPTYKASDVGEEGRGVVFVDPPSDNDQTPLQVMGPASETSNSDSGCEIIHLEPITKSSSVTAEVYELKHFK